ncbi:hypothetical protein C8Q74DRAFT_1194181, partial [Fomes fomentarius]
DNALPGSRWWKIVHSYTRTPVNAVWLVMVLSAVCGLLGLSETALSAFAECVSTVELAIFPSSPVCMRERGMLIIRGCRASVVGMYTSYITPIILWLTSGRDKLQRGPFSLGRWYMPIGIIAVAWVSFVIVLLMFPPTNRPTAETMSACSAGYSNLTSAESFIRSTAYPSSSGLSN